MRPPDASLGLPPGRILAGTSFMYQTEEDEPSEVDLDGRWTAWGRGSFLEFDGRGQRNIEREGYRILGREQFDRFAAWARALDPEETPFLFVVSAVPVLHARSALVGSDGSGWCNTKGTRTWFAKSWRRGGSG